MPLWANSVVILLNSRGWSSLRVVFSQTRNGNRLYWCKYIRNIDGATQRLKATVPDRRVWLLHLPVLSLLCAWTRHLKTRTRRQAICTSVLPASTTPVNKKNLSSWHPAPLLSENEQRVTEFLYQAVELPTSDCSIFTENESLVQISGDSRLKKWGGQCGAKEKVGGHT